MHCDWPIGADEIPPSLSALWLMRKGSVTRFGDLLDFGQFLKTFGGFLLDTLRKSNHTDYYI